MNNATLIHLQTLTKNLTQLYETITRHLSNFVLGAEHSAQYLCDRSTLIGRNDVLFSTDGDAYQVVLKDYPDEVNSVLQSAEDEMKYAHELLQSAEEWRENTKHTPRNRCHETRTKTYCHQPKSLYM